MRIANVAKLIIIGITFLVLRTSLTWAQINFSAPSASTPPSPTQKVEGRYVGPWVTLKNKKLDGTTNCEIKQLTVDKWQGRFWGEWQKVPFDYTVEFDRMKSPPNRDRLETGQTKVTRNVDLKNEPFGIPVAGKAMIDGASYEWIGGLTREQFNIEFTGSRYEGHLELTRVPEKKGGT